MIQSTVTLKTKHISFGCDRDANKCLQQHNLIDLLPRYSPWTKDLVYDEGGSDAVFHFDGNSGATVPSTLISHHDFAINPFSISTIFRHHNLLTSDKHTKEHIICSADDHSEYSNCYYVQGRSTNSKTFFCCCFFFNRNESSSHGIICP